MKLSALIITYNHQRYLAAAVASALGQITAFDFEVVVAEDHSSDGTRDILRQLEQRHLDKIRAIYRDNNLGATANLLDALNVCRGEYVALLEGDDCWTSPHKLQRQADFLDAHPQCSLCCHVVNYVHEEGSRPPQPFPVGAKRISTLEDILSEGANFHTCSFMFRRWLLSAPPDWLGELWIGDWPILMLLAEQGDVGFLDEVMAEYHIHPGGVWSDISPIRQTEGLLEVFQCTRRHLGARFSTVTARLVASQVCRLSRQLELAGRQPEARRRLLEAISVLLEEAPADKPLIDALYENVVWLASQGAAAGRAEVPAPLPDETIRLSAEVARRDSRIADLSAELALLKGSRTWRLRQRLRCLPWLRRRAS
jgi:hypothetical protein